MFQKGKPMVDDSQIWDYVRSGGKQKGLDLLRSAIEVEPSTKHIFWLGIAYLWHREYKTASEYFQTVIAANPATPSEFYGMSGVAKWCLGDLEEAERSWTAGLEIPRTQRVEDGRGIRLPMIMLASSILKPEDQRKLRATSALKDNLGSQISENLLAFIAENMLYDKQTMHCSNSPTVAAEMDEQQKIWLCDFYKAIVEYDRSAEADPDQHKRSEWKLMKTLNALAVVSKPEWRESAKFASLMSLEEFFIARHASYPWELLRIGKTEIGIDLLASEYEKQPSPSAIRSLGIAYLWTQDYETAWNHFQNAIKHARWSSDDEYGMAGVAKWCEGQAKEAVECWRAGLKCDYGDAGGASVGNQLLLFAASILRPEAISQKEAIALLKKKAGNRRISAWPGPFVGFCLNRGKTALDLEETNPGVESRRAMAKFYKSLIELDEGVLSKAKFNLQMRELTDTSLPQWREVSRSFTDLISNEEFFIARHEAVMG